jgi:hypothetical protein
MRVAKQYPRRRAAPTQIGGMTYAEIRFPLFGFMR